MSEPEQEQKKDTKQILKAMLTAIILCIGIGWLASTAQKNGYLEEGFILSITTAVIASIYMIGQLKYIKRSENRKKKNGTDR